jgi:phospholipid/cholesterol/gamma-HCH transport system substrate-binding protein
MASYARGRDALTVAAIAVVALIAFSFLFLHMTNRGLSLRRSDLYVRLASAGGLRAGDPVVFRGVQVGEVKKLTFLPEGDVVIRTRLLERVPLTADGHASLVAVDMFGRQSVVLHEGDYRARRLSDGDTLPGLQPQNMTVQLAELGRNAGRLTGDTTVLLLHAALDGMGAATASIAQLAAEMRTLVAAQRESVSLLTHSSARIAQNIEAATDPEALLQLRASAQHTTETLGRAATQLEASAGSLSTLLAAVDSGEGNAGLLLRDRALYDRTAELLLSAEALVTDLKENPKRYLTVRIF